MNSPITKVIIMPFSATTEMQQQSVDAEVCGRLKGTRLAEDTGLTDMHTHTYTHTLLHTYTTVLEF
jgi:hypothetical protein